MRRIAITLVLVLFAMVNVAHAADAKVGVVDMDKIFRNSESGKKALKELEDKFKPMQSDLESKKNELDKLREDFQKQGVAMSADARSKKEAELQKRARDFQDLLQNSQRTMKGEEDRLAKPIIESVFRLIKEYGKKNKYTMIIERNAGLLYFDETVDLTQTIISELNKSR